MKLNRTTICGCAALVAAGTLAFTAEAQFNFHNESGGPFLTATNWLPAGPPGANDLSVFDLGTGLNYTVTIQAPPHATDVITDRLRIGSHSVTFNPAIFSPANYYLDNPTTSESLSRGLIVGADSSDTSAVLVSHLS